MDNFIAGWSQRASSLRDGSEYLSGSVFNRCARALQARDEIGFAFFGDKDDDNRDLMTYHFDYLTMLLAGAIDAQARIAHALYGLKNPPLYRTAFHRDDFIASLKEAGAGELVNIAESHRFTAFRRLLGALRNTIHGTGLTELAVETRDQPRSHLLRVHGMESETVWEAARILGDPADYGITRLLGTELEPYKCAVSLTDLALQMVNLIAAATSRSDNTAAADPPIQMLTRRPQHIARKARVDALG